MSLKNQSSPDPAPGSDKKTKPLTYHQVVKAIAYLANECDTEVISMRRIQRRLLNEGRDVSLEQINKALRRAVKAGMIAEVVENRYKTVRSKTRAPTAKVSGSKGVVQRRSSQAVKPKLPGGLRKAGAILSGTKRPKTTVSKQVRKDASSTSGPKRPVQSRAKLTAGRKLPRAQSSSSTAQKRPGAQARGNLAPKPTPRTGKRVINVKAVKSKVKLLARAIATAVGKARRGNGAANIKRRGVQLKAKLMPQKGRGVAVRRGRSKNVYTDSRNSATEHDNRTGGVGRGDGDDADEGNDHEMADAGHSNDDLVQQAGRDGGYMHDSSGILNTANGYDVVSIFPGWAK